MTPTRSRDPAGTLAEVMESGSRIMARWLRRQMAANPYATLGIAAAAGYVLGNGLSPRFGVLVVRGASRAMMADMAGAVVRGVTDQDGRPAARV